MAKRQQDEMSRAEKISARRQQSRNQDTQSALWEQCHAQTKGHAHLCRSHADSYPVPVVTRKKHTAYVPLKKKGAELQVPALPRVSLAGVSSPVRSFCSHWPL
jgi:hypothetical protein